MQVGKRHVLIFDKPPVVKSVLGALSAGGDSEGGVRSEIRRGLREFSKHDGTRMILDLQVIEAPFGGTASSIRNISAYQLGEVLIITGQVTFPWILHIKEFGRRHSITRRLKSSFGALISNVVAEIETAVERIASPFRRTKENLGRVQAR